MVLMVSINVTTHSKMLCGAESYFCKTCAPAHIHIYSYIGLAPWLQDNKQHN